RGTGSMALDRNGAGDRRCSRCGSGLLRRSATEPQRSDPGVVGLFPRRGLVPLLDPAGGQPLAIPGLPVRHHPAGQTVRPSPAGSPRPAPEPVGLPRLPPQRLLARPSPGAEPTADDPRPSAVGIQGTCRPGVGSPVRDPVPCELVNRVVPPRTRPES